MKILFLTETMDNTLRKVIVGHDNEQYITQILLDPDHEECHTIAILLEIQKEITSYKALKISSL
jgi:hypothetical protein